MSGRDLQRVLSDESLNLITNHPHVTAYLVDEDRLLEIRGDGISIFNLEETMAYYRKALFPNFLTGFQTIVFMGYDRETAMKLWEGFCSIPEDDMERERYERFCCNQLTGARLPFCGSWHLAHFVDMQFDRTFPQEFKRDGRVNLQHVGIPDETITAIFQIGAELSDIPAVSKDLLTAENLKNWASLLFRRRFYALEQLDYRVKKELGDRSKDYGILSHEANMERRAKALKLELPQGYFHSF